MSLLEVSAYLNDGCVNLLYGLTVHIDFRECEFAVVSLHVLKGPFYIAAEFPVFAEISQIIDLELVKNLLHLLSLPAVYHFHCLMQFCEETIKFLMYLCLVVIYLTVLHLTKLLLKDPEVVLEALHYIDYYGAQVKHIMIFVVAIYRADLTDKEFMAPTTHLGHGETVQGTELRGDRCT